MKIETIHHRIENGEKLVNICYEHSLNYDAYRQKLYRYRKKRKTPSIIIPSYISFINWCRKNPDLPLTKQMVKNCEDNERRHWRSIVINTFELLTYYLEKDSISPS